jgi:hypothetical protein
MRKDLYNNIEPLLTIYPQAITAAADGDAIIDMSGSFGATIIVQAGTITDGTLYTFELEEGDNSALSDGAAVAAADLLGLEPDFAAAEDNTVQRFGYIGNKRYIRLNISAVTGGPSTGGVFSAVIILWPKRNSPVS